MDRTREILALKKQNAALQKLLAELQNRIQKIEQRKSVVGPRGEQGIAGSAGTPGPRGLDGVAGKNGRDGKNGTITIVLIDQNGNELKRATGVVSGSTVRLPVRRFLRKEK